MRRRVIEIAAGARAGLVAERLLEQLPRGGGFKIGGGRGVVAAFGVENTAVESDAGGIVARLPGGVEVA